MRWSVTQSPPLTPTPPIHSPSTMTGDPPSVAVQRFGPAASASRLHEQDRAPVPAHQVPTLNVWSRMHKPPWWLLSAECGIAPHPSARARSRGRLHRLPRSTRHTQSLCGWYLNARAAALMRRVLLGTRKRYGLPSRTSQPSSSKAN